MEFQLDTPVGRLVLGLVLGFFAFRFGQWLAGRCGRG